MVMQPHAMGNTSHDRARPSTKLDGRTAHWTFCKYSASVSALPSESIKLPAAF